MWTYPTKYRDAHGEEFTTIENNGQELRIVLRDVSFAGPTPDLLEPEDASGERLATFSLCQNCLNACVMEWEMNVLITSVNDCKAAKLLVYFELGNPNPPRGLANEIVRLRLVVDGADYQSSGISGWFEDEMLDLQRRLPDGLYIKTCMNCLYSDYSPAGHGVFGDMMCFRNKKQEYLKIKGKAGFWALGEPAEYVQETYLCPEFELRKPRTGYRG